MSLMWFSFVKIYLQCVTVVISINYVNTSFIQTTNMERVIFKLDTENRAVKKKYIKVNNGI